MAAAASLHGWRPEHWVPGTYGRPEAQNAPKLTRENKQALSLGRWGPAEVRGCRVATALSGPPPCNRAPVGALAPLLPRWPPLLCVPGHPAAQSPHPAPAPVPAQPPPPAARPQPPRGNPTLGLHLVGGGRTGALLR